MQARKVVLGLAVALVLVAGLVVSCGGPTPPQATPEEEAEPQPTEAPQEPEEEPTEPPAEEEPIEPPPEEGLALLEERCTDCHGLDRVTRAQKTAEEWAQTVDRMIDKGAQLDADERDVLIDYLTQTYGP